MRDPQAALNRLTDNPPQPLSSETIGRVFRPRWVINRLHLSVKDRRKLNLILKDPNRTASHKMRVRLLLHAADLGASQSGRELARSTGVSHQTIYTVLRNPTSTLARLLNTVP
jgi:hypothetical protein